MPEASSEPISDIASPRCTSILEGMNSQMPSLAGYFQPWLEPFGKSLSLSLCCFNKDLQKLMRHFRKGNSRTLCIR
jgi:hypothetical protein